MFDHESNSDLSGIYLFTITTKFYQKQAIAENVYDNQIKKRYKIRIYRPRRFACYYLLANEIRS